MPIRGAVKVAALMNFPSAPMTGNKFQTEKTTYNAAKQVVRAIMRVDTTCDFGITRVLAKDLFFICSLQNEEVAS